jgi:hypothetical protein
MLLVLCLVPAGAGVAGPAQQSLSGIQILAIAPFDDQPSLTRALADYGTSRLFDLMRRGPFQVLDPAQVAAAMNRLRMTRADLVSPSRTIELGRAVGADAILTGRLTLYQADVRPRFLLPDPFGINTIQARVDVDIRILQVDTRLKLFENEFSCTVYNRPARAAMDCLVGDVSRQLLPGGAGTY